MILTTSWDDGHPLDLRIAELLEKYGIKGTFYIPCHNIEGRDVMSARQICEIDKAFEIASHTYNHVRLDTLNAEQAREQITKGKYYLEDVTGHSIEGFCYPGGAWTESSERIIEEIGFKYARTIVNFHTGSTTNQYRMPTTLQFYSHDRQVYIRNYIMHGHWIERLPVFVISIELKDIVSRLHAIFDSLVFTNSILHIWGHSWEIEEQNSWGLLEEILRHFSQHSEKIRILDNTSVIDY